MWVVALAVMGPLLVMWGWGQMAPPPPPDIPQYVATMGTGQLTIIWTQRGPDGDTVQRYTYRVYVEGQKTGTILPNIGCDGPLGTPPYPTTFQCQVSPPTLVKTPGIYRVYLTVAHSSDAKESLPSNTAPFNVRYPPPQPVHAVIMK